MFAPFLKETLLIIALLSGVPLFFSSLLGLVISIVQAATQIQEQAIIYFVKFFTLMAVIVLFGGWGGEQVVAYTREVLTGLSELGKSL